MSVGWELEENIMKIEAESRKNASSESPTEKGDDFRVSRLT